MIISTLFYFSQGVVLPEGEIIGVIFLFIILLISFFYLIKVLINKELFKGITKVWFLFLLVDVFYFIFTANYKKEADINIFKMVLLNFLPFFPALYFAKLKILNRKILLLFFTLSLPIFIIKFRISFYVLQFLQNRDEVVDNTVYLLIGLLPFAFFFKKKILSISSLLVIWFFMVQSSKRAAIVSGILAILLFLYQVIFASKYKYKIKAYFIAILLTIGITYFAYNFYSENEYLSKRMELMVSGDSTGRDELIDLHYRRWYASNSVIVYIFGLGYNSIMMFNELGAHNDWMDVLGSFGVFGLLIYLILWYYLVRELFKGKWDKNKKIIMILFLGISFIASLFFRWYNSPFPFMNFLILPYLIITKEDEM